MPISIHLATPRDVDSLLLLMRHMQLDDPWDQPPDESTVRNNLLQLLQDSTCGLILIAREEHTPIAYLVICFDFSLEYHGKGAWVDELFVEPAYRGKGIAPNFSTLPNVRLSTTAQRHCISKLPTAITPSNSTAVAVSSIITDI